MTSHLLAFFTVVLPLQAVTVFQIESFDGPTGWTTPPINPNPPVVQADAGPLGPGDFALRVSGNGVGRAGSRPIVFNVTDWTGDYSGISSLTMDLRNVGQTNLVMHVAVNGPGGWFTTPGQALNRFQPWSSHEFFLDPAALNPAGGTDAAATLGNVTEIRILHSTSEFAFQGDPINGQFLVDNIRAVPEPGTALMLLGMVTILCRRNRLLV